MVWLATLPAGFLRWNRKAARVAEEEPSVRKVGRGGGDETRREERAG